MTKVYQKKIKYTVHSIRANQRFYGRFILENKEFDNKKDAYDYLMKRMKKLILPRDRKSIDTLTGKCKRNHIWYDFCLIVELDAEIRFSSEKYSYEEFLELLDKYNNNPNSAKEDYEKLLVYNVDARYYDQNGNYIESNEHYKYPGEEGKIWIKDSVEY